MDDIRKTIFSTFQAFVGRVSGKCFLDKRFRASVTCHSCMKLSDQFSG